MSQHLNEAILPGILFAAALLCLGYELGRWMEGLSPRRFYRYFMKEDWRALGHCHCCPARADSDSPSDEGAPRGADHAREAA